jgi:hypothetical protein
VGRFLLVTPCITMRHYGSMHGSSYGQIADSVRVERAVRITARFANLCPFVRYPGAVDASSSQADAQGTAGDRRPCQDLSVTESHQAEGQPSCTSAQIDSVLEVCLAQLSCVAYISAISARSPSQLRKGLTYLRISGCARIEPRFAAPCLRPSCMPVRAVHLHHPDVGRGQVPGQARAVTAGPLDAGQGHGPEPAQQPSRLAYPAAVAGNS